MRKKKNGKRSGKRNGRKHRGVNKASGARSQGRRLGRGGKKCIDLSLDFEEKALVDIRQMSWKLPKKKSVMAPSEFLEAYKKSCGWVLSCLLQYESDEALLSFVGETLNDLKRLDDIVVAGERSACVHPLCAVLLQVCFFYACGAPVSSVQDLAHGGGLFWKDDSGVDAGLCGLREFSVNGELLLHIVGER